MDILPLPKDFDARAILRADGLEIRPLEAADKAALTEAASDPGIWEGHPATDRWKPEVFAAYFEFLYDAGGAVVILDTDGRAIGLSRYYASADAPGGIGIGFTFLVRAHWGGATNFGVKRLMIEHVFAHAPEVWFHISPTNVRSQKATEKLGAQRVADASLDLGTGRTDWVRMVLRPAAWARIRAAR